MNNVFAFRLNGNAESLCSPEPGEVRDSIRLAHADGVPSTFPVRRTVLRDVGRLVRARRQVLPLPATLIVTDCRAAVASSAAAATDVAGRMWMAHVRFGWLDEVAFRDEAVRLRFGHPSGVRMELVAQLETPDANGAAAHEVARRASLHGAGRFATCPRAGHWRRLIAATGATS